MNSTSFSDNESMSNLVIIEQKLVVFDVDQNTNATQTIHLRRANGAALVAWRFQTNAPTRYLISPNEGIFVNDETVKVTIELVGNKFNPLHKLRLQAISIINKADWPEVWDKQNAQEAVFTAWIELSTTMMNLVRTSNLSVDESTNRSSILDLSTSIAVERVKELEDLQIILREDRNTLIKNTEQTINLKEIIIKQLKNRKKQSSELYRKLAKLQLEYHNLQAEVQRDENDLQNIRNKTSSHTTTCLIM